MDTMPLCMCAWERAVISVSVDSIALLRSTRDNEIIMRVKYCQEIYIVLCQLKPIGAKQVALFSALNMFSRSQFSKAIGRKF